MSTDHGKTDSNAAEIDEGGDQEQELAAKKTRKSKVWLPAENFDNNDELDAFLCRENWKKNKTTRTTDGLKIYYYCGIAKYGKKSCEAQIYIFIRADTTCTVFRNGEHNHEDENVPMSNIPVDRISSLVRANVKFRGISHLIRADENIEVQPSDNQVRSCGFMSF